MYKLICLFLFIFITNISFASKNGSGDLKISSDSMNINESVIASVTLTNSGKYKGKEVVQLYLRDLYGSLTRPLKELKGFEMVELEPGESKAVNFTIDNSLLK